MKHVVVVRR